MDAAARAQVVQVLVWCVPVGLLMGVFLGGFLGARAAAGRVWIWFLLGLVAPPVLMVCVALLAAGAAGRLASTLWSPSGGATPRRPEHSRPRALVSRGRLEEGVAAWEQVVAADPSDVGARLSLARVHRDELDDPRAAARWFRSALEPGADPGLEHLALRELVELHESRLGGARGAAPDLARYAERREGTAEGRWARERLAEVKRTLAAEDAAARREAAPPGGEPS